MNGISTIKTPVKLSPEKREQIQARTQMDNERELDLAVRRNLISSLRILNRKLGLTVCGKCGEDSCK